MYFLVISMIRIHFHEFFPKISEKSYVHNKKLNQFNDIQSEKLHDI